MIDNSLYTVMGAQDKLQQCALIIGRIVRQYAYAYICT